MKLGKTITYKGYTISHPIKDDYITEIAHDSLRDAEQFIDDLLKQGLIEEVKL